MFPTITRPWRRRVVASCLTAVGRPVAVVNHVLLRSLSTTSERTIGDFLSASRSARATSALLTNVVPHGITVLPDEVLLYSSGAATTRRLTVLIGGTAAAVMCSGVSISSGIYVGTNLSWIPGVFTAVSFTATMLAIFTVRAAIKHIVLEADGAHLRFYPHTFPSALGWPSEPRPVRIAIPLLSIMSAAGTKASSSNTSSLLVSIKGNSGHLEIEKPASLEKCVSGPDSGLMWNTAGLCGVIPAVQPSADHPTPALGSSAAVASRSEAAEGVPGSVVSLDSALEGLVASERADLRRYALLMLALQGNAVSPAGMDAIRSGDWELQSMREQLLSSSSTKAARINELRFWRQAGGGGEPLYWFNELTWAAQREEPTVDGKGPREWFPSNLDATTGSAVSSTVTASTQ